MSRTARVSIYVLLLITAPSSFLLIVPTTVRYRITERYEIATNQPSGDVRLVIMVPRSGPYQTIGNVTTAWSGTESREIHDSVDVIRLQSVDGSDGSTVATITYDAALRQGRVKWEADVRAGDLEPQDEIESNAPVLIVQAEAICTGQPKHNAQSVYTFTADYLSWPEGDRTGGEPSALTAYETGIGVCGEFANLMTALCRACEIPAKSITGLSLPMLLPPLFQQTRTWMHPGGAHAWNEVYTGEVWEIADPSWAGSYPFDRLWFGRSFGQYLSYGDTADHDRVYEEMVAWAAAGGEIIGAMSAPLKFAASHSISDAAIEPEVTVKKTADPRLIGAAGIYLAILGGAGGVETYYRKKR